MFHLEVYRSKFLRNQSNAPSEEAKEALVKLNLEPSQSLVDKTMVIFHDVSTF